MSDKKNQTEEFDFDDLENESADISIDDGIKENESTDISIDDGIKENEEKNNNLNQDENQNQRENDDEVEIEVDEDDLEADNSETIATDSNIADPAKINPQDENRDFFMPGMESANFNKDNFNVDDDDISIEHDDGETENNSADNKELDENEAANAEKQQNNLVEKAKEFWQKNKIGVLVGTAALAGLVGFKMFLNQEKTMPEISTTPSTIKIIKPQQANSNVQQANSNVSQNNSNANIENNVENKQINSNPMDDIDDIENQALEKLNNNKNANKDLDLTKNVTKRNFFDDNLLDNSTDNKNSQTKIDELYKENQKLKQQLEQLNKGQETKQITKKSTSNVVASKKMYYSIRSIRSGKAWVDIGAGKVIIVQGGDMLPNGARVQSISASCVNTNKGQFCSH